jgi:LacI family transcriptional regulator
MVKRTEQMGRVTLQDVASRVGVDRSTVSRVLANKAAEGGISASLAQKILRQAQQLNYAPNVSARAMRMGRFHCAALLLSTESGRSYLPSRLLDGIHDELASVDMHLTVAKMPDERLNSRSYVPKILRTLMADGMLINYTMHLPEHLVEVVDQRQLPAIWMNTVRAQDAVYPRNQEASRTVTQRLISSGHRRIAYVDLCHGSGDVGSAHFSVIDRLKGYTQAMRQAGLSPWEIRPDKPCLDFDAELRFATELLRRPDRPTAMVCYFSIFVPALVRAAWEVGVRVPQDLSIVTFAPENYHEERLMVSAMVEPHYLMGKEAVRALQMKIKQPLESVAPRTPDFQWHDMGTVVAPAAPKN